MQCISYHSLIFFFVELCVCVCAVHININSCQLCSHTIILARTSYTNLNVVKLKFNSALFSHQVALGSTRASNSPNNEYFWWFNRRNIGHINRRIHRSKLGIKNFLFVSLSHWSHAWIVRCQERSARSIVSERSVCGHHSAQISTSQEIKNFENWS